MKYSRRLIRFEFGSVMPVTRSCWTEFIATANQLGNKLYTLDVGLHYTTSGSVDSNSCLRSAVRTDCGWGINQEWITYKTSRQIGNKKTYYSDFFRGRSRVLLRAVFSSYKVSGLESKPDCHDDSHFLIWFACFVSFGFLVK